MAFVITPTQANYRIGETVDLMVDAIDLLANEGDTVELYIFDFSAGDGFSELIDTVLATGGVISFADIVIPAGVLTGADRNFVARRVLDNAEAFSDPFTLLAGAGGGQQKLGLGIGLGLG